MTAKRQWTTTELRLVRQAWDDGLEVGVIAAMVDRTVSAIYGAARRFGLANRRGPSWTDREASELRRMVAEGMRGKQIAEALHRPVPTVYRKAAAMGISFFAARRELRCRSDQR